MKRLLPAEIEALPEIERLRYQLWSMTEHRDQLQGIVDELCNVLADRYGWDEDEFRGYGIGPMII
jgi:hypothetical protein